MNSDDKQPASHCFLLVPKAFTIYISKRKGWESGRAMSCYCTSCIHEVDLEPFFGWLSWVCCTFRLRARVLLFSVVLLKPRSLSWSTSRPEPRATAQASLTLLSSFFFPLFCCWCMRLCFVQRGAHPLSCVLFVASSLCVFIPFRYVCCPEWGYNNVPSLHPASQSGQSNFRQFIVKTGSIIKIYNI